MLLEYEQKIIAVTQQLNSICVTLFNAGKHKQALVVWKALLRAAQKDFLPETALTLFFNETTRLLIPILNQSLIKEVLNLYNDKPITNLVEKESIDTVFTIQSELLKATKSKQIKKNNDAPCVDLESLSHEPIDFPHTLSLLRSYTSTYQATKIKTTSFENKQKLEEESQKITQHQQDFLTDYYIDAWQYYESLLDKTLTANDYYQALCWLKELIISEDTRQKEKNEVPDWQRYRQELNDIREKCIQSLPKLPLQDEQAVDQVFAAQHEFNENIRKKFLNTIFMDCEKKLSKSPCAFAIVGGGSMSRDEQTLFSDFEFWLIVDAKKSNLALRMAYFRSLLQLLRFNIQSLGESGMGCEPKGFIVDDGISPDIIGKMPLRGIGSAQEIIKLYSSNDIDAASQEQASRSAEFYTILHSVYLYGSKTEDDYSGETLFIEFQKKIQDLLNTPIRSELTTRQAFLEYQLPSHIEDFKTKQPEPLKRSDCFAIKEAYSSIFTYVAFDLAFKQGLVIENDIDALSNSAKVWQALYDANMIDEPMLKFTKRSIALIMVLRFNAQYKYQQQVKPELIAASNDARQHALTWSAPPQWWGINSELTTPSLEKQLISVSLYPSIDNVYALNEETYLQLAATDWLLIRPMLLTLSGINSDTIATLNKYNFLEHHFIALLKQAMQSDAPSMLDDFLKCVTDYIQYAKSIFPISANTVLDAIAIKNLDQQTQLLILDTLGRHFPIEKTKLELPFSHREINSLLHQSTSLQKVGAINMLLRADASVNEKDDTNQTALHVFATHIMNYNLKDEILACSLLLNHCNTINDYDKKGQTPLLHLITSIQNAPTIVKNVLIEFVKHGANINAVDFISGESLLDKAVVLQDPIAFEILVELGASQLKNIDDALNFIETYQTQDRKISLLNKLQQQNNELAWRVALRSILLPLPEKDTQVLQGAKGGLRYLSTKLEYEEPEFGRHDVKIVKKNGQCQLAIKPNPELPGIEIAVTKLAHFLFGHGTPLSELFKASPQKNIASPVLISQAIAGENLQTILKSPDWGKKLEQLDPARYWEMIFLSLLVLWEDGIPSNFKVVPFIDSKGSNSYYLVCIDNDHAFVKAKNLNKNGVYELQAKCILWFFSQINTTIDSSARERFIKHNPFVFFKYWLDSLHEDQKNHFKLFSEKSDRSYLLFKQKENMQTAISIPIRKHLKSIYIRFNRLQRFLTKHPDANGLELIAYVIPSIGDLVRQGYHAGETPIERLKAMGNLVKISLGESTSGDFHTLASATKILDMQEIPPKEMIEENNIHGPEFALHDLQILAKEVDALLNTKESLLDNKFDPFIKIINTELKEKILSGLSFSSLNKEQQKKLINIIKSGGFYKLTIRDSIELTDNDLMEIIKKSPELTSLTLINCQQITNRVFLTIVQFGSAINKLTLCSLPNIKNIFKGIFRQNDISIVPDAFNHAEGIKLDHVKELNIQDCGIQHLNLQASQLTKAFIAISRCNSVNIDAKKLQELKIDKSLISEITCLSPNLKRIQLKDCVRLMHIRTTSTELQSVQMDNCKQVSLKSFTELCKGECLLNEFVCKDHSQQFLMNFITKYPYLLSSDLADYTEALNDKKLVDKIDTFLQNALSGRETIHHKKNWKKDILKLLESYQTFVMLRGTIETNHTTASNENLHEVKDCGEIAATIMLPVLLDSNPDKLVSVLLSQLNSQNKNLKILSINSLKQYAKDFHHLFLDTLFKEFHHNKNDDDIRKIILETIKCCLPNPQCADTIASYVIDVSKTNRCQNDFFELLEACVNYCSNDTKKYVNQSLLEFENDNIESPALKLSLERLRQIYYYHIYDLRKSLPSDYIFNFNGKKIIQQLIIYDYDAKGNIIGFHYDLKLINIIRNYLSNPPNHARYSAWVYHELLEATLNKSAISDNCTRKFTDLLIEFAGYANKNDVSTLISLIKSSDSVEKVFLALEILQAVSIDHAPEIIGFILENLPKDKSDFTNFFAPSFVPSKVNILNKWPAFDGTFTSLLFSQNDFYSNMFSILKRFAPLEARKICRPLVELLNIGDLNKDVIIKISDVLLAYSSLHREFILPEIFIKFENPRSQQNAAIVLQNFVPHFPEIIIPKILKLLKRGNPEKKHELIQILTTHGYTLDTKYLKEIATHIKQYSNEASMVMLLLSLLKDHNFKSFSDATLLVLQWCNLQTFDLNCIKSPFIFPKEFFDLTQAILKNDINLLLSVQNTITKKFENESYKYSSYYLDLKYFSMSLLKEARESVQWEVVSKKLEHSTSAAFFIYSKLLSDHMLNTTTQSESGYLLLIMDEITRLFEPSVFLKQLHANDFKKMHKAYCPEDYIANEKLEQELTVEETMPAQKRY